MSCTSSGGCMKEGLSAASFEVDSEEEQNAKCGSWRHQGSKSNS